MSISSATAAELIMSGYQESLQATAAAPAAAAAAAAAAPQNFCTLWPKAKPILQVLAGIAAIIPIPIPGGGVAAGGVLAGLIKLGDQIHAETCK